MIPISKVSNKLSRFYVDEFNMSGALNAVTSTLDQPEVDITTFSDTGPRTLIDYYRTRDEFSGFFIDTDDDFDERIHALVGDENDHYLLKLWGSNVENAVAYEAIGRLTNKPISGRSGGVVMLNAAFSGSDACSRGTLLRSATVTGTGQGTGRNLGATLAGVTFQTVFRVLSGTFTSITLAIQESSDDGVGDAYAAIAGLSNVFTAVGVSRKTTTAATEAYKRVAVTAFTGTNAVILVTAGRVAGF